MGTSRLVIVSGLSGSGKTIVLNALEDLDYYCIDNLPICLIPSLSDVIQRTDDALYDYTAVGIDARCRADELQAFPQLLEKLTNMSIEYDIIFLQSDVEVILKRFSETRRKHPLTHSQLALADAIEKEKALLSPVIEKADLFIDTSNTNVHQLREIIRSRVHQKHHELSILFQSFGFKYGVPNDADFVFDVRCLPNPHWETQLRPLTGLDNKVATYLETHAAVHDMVNHIQGFLAHWIPQFQQDNRSYLTVAIGCTGGQHRSVYTAEKISQAFIEKYPQVMVRHRELT